MARFYCKWTELSEVAAAPPSLLAGVYSGCLPVDLRFQAGNND